MLPNARGYVHDPILLRRWVARTGLRPAKVAEMVGVGYRTLKNYMRVSGGRRAPYAVFYTVMVLALVNEKIGKTFPPQAAVSGL